MPCFLYLGLCPTHTHSSDFSYIPVRLHKLCFLSCAGMDLLWLSFLGLVRISQRVTQRFIGFCDDVTPCKCEYHFFSLHDVSNLPLWHFPTLSHTPSTRGFLRKFTTRHKIERYCVLLVLDGIGLPAFGENG